MHIILSAGHHAKAKGATWKELNEFDVASKWIDYISEYLALKTTNFTIVEPGTLTAKVKAVNAVSKAKGKCLAIELHFNSAGLSLVSGNETLYCPGSVTGKQIAQKYNKSFVELCSFIKKDRGVKEGWLRQDAPGRVDYPGDVDGDESMLYFLKATSCPALILEPMFMCELEHLSEAQQKTVCKSIAESLLLTIQ